MIIVKDYYKLLLTIAGQEFADANDIKIIDLSIIEEAGIRLPTMELIFDCVKQDIIALLHEGSELKVSLETDGEYNSGYTLEETFFLLNPSISYNGHNMWRVRLVGIHKCHPQWIKPQHGIQIPPLNSKKMLISKVGVFGGVDLMWPGDPPDTMHWIANGQTLCQYIQDIWLHADLMPSALLCAATHAGFRMYDMDILVKSGPRWEANYQGVPNPSKIIYEPLYEVETRTAMVNTLGAKGMDRNIYHTDKGKLAKETHDRSLKLVQTPRDNVSGQQPKNYNPTVFQSRNVHSNWGKCYDHNTLFLKYLSTMKTTILFSDCIKAIHPLDTVMFFERVLDDHGQILQSTEQNSGLYIVTKVSRRLVNNTIRTLVEMCRESAVLKG